MRRITGYITFGLLWAIFTTVPISWYSTPGSSLLEANVLIVAIVNNIIINLFLGIVLGSVAVANTPNFGTLDLSLEIFLTTNGDGLRYLQWRTTLLALLLFPFRSWHFSHYQITTAHKSL